MKIAFFEVSSEDEQYYRELLSGHTLVFCPDTLTPTTATVALDAESVSVFVNSVVTKDIIDLFPQLTYITTRSTGFDHIDHVYAKQKGITVSNVPGYGSDTVAEFTFGLILNLSRNLFTAAHQIKEGAHFSLKHLRGFDLKGKTIGIIGTGRIGKNVIRIANGFGMRVVAYDPHPDLVYAQEHHYEYVPFDSLVQHADIITLHSPYTHENHHLLDARAFNMMKQGVCIINTARGELIDTEALLNAITTGLVRGAALDVLEDERMLKEEVGFIHNELHTSTVDYKTLLEDHVLINMPQVIITPHIAFYSQEAEAEIIHTTVANITAFVAGSPQNVVGS